MTPAKNLTLFPAPMVEKGAKGRRGFTSLDNEQDMALLYALDNALVKPALVLYAHRNMRPVHWGDVAALLNRGHSTTLANLGKLADLGHAVSFDGQWAWVGSKAAGQLEIRKSGEKSGRKTIRKTGMKAAKKAVQDERNPDPKEVKLSKRSKYTYINNVSYTNWPGQPVPVGAAVVSHQVKLSNLVQGRAPDGAASDEAGTGHLGSFQVEPTHTHGGLENVTGTEDIPAAPAAPQTFREAQEVLTATGMWDIWAAWTKARRLDRAAQDAQIVQFATWAQAGLSTELRQNASEITAAGSYAHPYLALADRMKRAAKVAESEAANRDELRRTYGEPRCQPGERRLAPSGQVWTVDYVEYGLVYFAESGAPMDQGDAIVARWPLDGEA